MDHRGRRRFLKTALQFTGASVIFPSISQALEIPRSGLTHSVKDVNHIVVLLENRSFDYYFGSLKGDRGFRFRHPVPLSKGKPIWHQWDGESEIQPFHLELGWNS